MRPLAVVLVAAIILFGVYQFYLKKLPVTDQGTAPTQAISLTGVRTDLLKIAQAERTYIATNGNCATLDELVSSNTLRAMAHQEKEHLYGWRFDWFGCGDNDSRDSPGRAVYLLPRAQIAHRRTACSHCSRRRNSDGARA